MQSELNSLVTKKNTLNIGLDLIKPKLARLEEKKQLLKKKYTIEDELLWANKKIIQEEIDNLMEQVVKSRVNIDLLNNEIKSCENEINKYQVQIKKISTDITKMSKKGGELDYKKKELIKKIETAKR